jgi:hypothetical protein
MRILLINRPAKQNNDTVVWLGGHRVCRGIPGIPCRSATGTKSSISMTGRGGTRPERFWPIQYPQLMTIIYLRWSKIAEKRKYSLEFEIQSKLMHLKNIESMEWEF